MIRLERDDVARDERGVVFERKESPSRKRGALFTYPSSMQVGGNGAKTAVRVVRGD
jgi:hypothetical protein